ncbi:MAG: hypothetical protein M0026_00350 [Nocardiopsaceae bacterium]|nr:hypothetical protein [Nocardiopsaceae bacterium]
MCKGAVGNGPGPGFARKACGYGLILAVVPYAAMKVMWLSGYPIGVPEGSPAAGSEFAAANVITLGMDIVAVVLALALTQNWGMRIPAAPVLATGWVGTGLLVPTVLQVPAGLVHGLLTSGQAVDMEGGLVTDTAYAVVYGSFALQGALLSAAFLLYSRERWADVFVFVPSTAEGSTRAHAQRAIAAAAAAGALCVGTVSITGALLAPPGWNDVWTPESRLTLGLYSAVVLTAVPGVLIMVGSPLVPERLRRRPFGVGATLTWIGSGALFGWGGFRTLAQVMRAPMSDLAAPVERVTDLVAMLSGLAIGVLGVLLLAEVRDRAVDREWPPAAAAHIRQRFRAQSAPPSLESR